MRIINAVLPAVLAISVFASAQDTTSPVSDSEVQSLINKVDQDLIPTLQAAAVGSEMRGMPSDELRGAIKQLTALVESIRTKGFNAHGLVVLFMIIDGGRESLQACSLYASIDGDNDEMLNRGRKHNDFAKFAADCTEKRLAVSPIWSTSSHLALRAVDQLMLVKAACPSDHDKNVVIEEH